MATLPVTDQVEEEASELQFPKGYFNLICFFLIKENEY